MLDCAEGTVKSRCSRGRDRLAALLRDQLVVTHRHADTRNRARTVRSPPPSHATPCPGRRCTVTDDPTPATIPPRSRRYAASSPRPATTSRCRPTWRRGSTACSPTCRHAEPTVARTGAPAEPDGSEPVDASSPTCPSSAGAGRPVCSPPRPRSWSAESSSPRTCPCGSGAHGLGRPGRGAKATGSPPATPRAAAPGRPPPPQPGRQDSPHRDGEGPAPRRPRRRTAATSPRRPGRPATAAPATHDAGRLRPAAAPARHRRVRTRWSPALYRRAPAALVYHLPDARPGRRPARVRHRTADPDRHPAGTLSRARPGTSPRGAGGVRGNQRSPTICWNVWSDAPPVTRPDPDRHQELSHVAVPVRRAGPQRHHRRAPARPVTPRRSTPPAPPCTRWCSRAR